MKIQAVFYNTSQAKPFNIWYTFILCTLVKDPQRKRSKYWKREKWIRVSFRNIKRDFDGKLDKFLESHAMNGPLIRRKVCSSYYDIPTEFGYFEHEYKKAINAG